MKVLAASIQQAADTFLHAGYISAHPRTMGKWFPESAHKVQLELAEALRLEGESLAGGTPGDVGGSLTAMVDGADWHLVGGALCFFGALGALYVVRGRLSGPRRALSTAAVVSLALLALTLVGWNQIGPPAAAAAAPPRVAKQAYANPAQATTALLHGVIADAVINHGSRRRVRSLTQVRRTVALPLPSQQLTRGMKYALKTYHLDGWGRPFKISGGWHVGYRIRSAGADGKFRSGDEQQILVKQATSETWDSNRWAYYVRKHAGNPVVLFRSHHSRNFRYRNRASAMAATGSRAFDLFELGEVPRKARRRLERLHYKLALRSKRAPLALVVFGRSY